MKPKNILTGLLFLFLYINSFCTSILAQVVFSIESKQAEQGEHICINVRVNNFKDILSAQLTLNWDPAIITLDSIGDFGLPGLSLSNFGTNKAAQGISSLSWIDFTAQGKTLNDGSVLFKMCFNVIGASGSSSIVDITDNPIQIEITDLNSNGENIGSVVNSGTVSVNTASSALYFDSTLVVLPGYTCNKLTVRNIQSIEKLSGTVAWDPALLSFDSICCMHPDLNYSSVNTFQSANGVILLNIDQGNAININSENVLFGVCFTGIGKPAEIAKIELDGSWFPYEIKAIPAGPVKVTKGLVSFQLKDLHFKGLEIKAKKGDIIEYPVVNSYPFSLLNLQGSLQFNTSQLNYTGFRKAKLDSMTEDSLNLSQLTDGQIGYSWTSKSPPLSCLVNDTLFFIKYQIVGDEDTTQLYGNNTVFNQSATIQNTSVFNLPIIVDTSFIIILPSGPKFQEEEGFGVTGDTVCTKLLVTDMKNVTGFKLELDYDSNLLKAIAVNSINVPNDPVWNITINNGKITIDWKDYTFSNGLTLNNGDALLEFCFELIGSSGTVGSIDLNTSTSFISRSDYPNDSFNISMEPGKINILSSSVLNFQSFIKNNPCEGDAQGDIKINIEGGKSPFQFLWSDGASSQNRLNLKDGFYSLTINDSSNPTQLISSSFEIKHYADNPKVYPIQDTQIKCPGDSIIVNSNAAKFQLNWYGPNAGIQALANGKAIINLPGIYSVKLYDVSTSCYSLDTFEIFTAPVLEPADAGPDQHSCEEILLNAIQSSDISGYWISTANVQLKDPGQKITEVLDLESGPSQFIWTISTADCPAYDSDSVWVFVPFPPIALDDNLNIQLSKKLNILENDLTKNGPFSLVLSDSFPKEIEIAPNGLLRYKGTADQLPVTLYYKLCSTECPSLCSTASINIFNDTSLIHNMPLVIVPNVISPNNDGVNDLLAFPQLDLVKYPNARIIIFDRAGRIVYKNNHYQNDWSGIDSNSQDLAVDSYYYVLWLSFSDGVPIKGPITILK